MSTFELDQAVGRHPATMSKQMKLEREQAQERGQVMHRRVERYARERGLEPAPVAMLLGFNVVVQAASADEVHDATVEALSLLPERDARLVMDTVGVRYGLKTGVGVRSVLLAERVAQVYERLAEPLFAAGR